MLKLKRLFKITGFIFVELIVLFGLSGNQQDLTGFGNLLGLSK